MKITLLAMVLIAHVACAQQVSSQFLAAPYPTEQNAKTQDNFLLWATGGAGVMAPGLGGVLRLAYAWDDISSVSLKAAGASDFFGFIFGAVNYVGEYGIYYGRHSLTELTMLRIAGGAAYLERGEQGKVYYRLGVGFELEAMLKYKVIGIGLMFNYMLARDISLPGLTINFSLGKLE